MAGKKGQVVQLQLEVNTDEEWEKLLEKDGLIVVDIYSEWCGPCLGMVGTLKKIKLEIGGDFLTFAIAKAEGVEILARFRNKSEPTWMFIAGGQLVNLMFGADAPRLTKLIINEIEKEQEVLKGARDRDAMPFDELTPEEQIRQEERERILRAAREQEEAALATLKAAAHWKEIRNLIKYITNYTVILLMPYLYEDGISEAWQTLMEELSSLGYTVHDEEKFDFDVSLAEELLYGGMEEVSNELKEELEAGQTVVKLMVYRSSEMEDIIIEMEPTEEEVEPTEEDIEKVQATETDALFGVVKTIYGSLPPERSGEELIIEPDSLEAKYRKSENIPAFWTPYTPTAKANAILNLFPKFAQNYAVPPPPILPPVITLIFDASKSPAVNEMMQEYQDEIIAMAYFTGSDPSAARKVALNQEQYEKRHVRPPGETMVLVLNRERSDPLLSFCQLGPTYISTGVEDGKKDYEAFFPPEEEEEEFIEPEYEPEPEAPPEEDTATEAEEVSMYSYEKATTYVEEYDTVSGLSMLPPMEVKEEVAPEEPIEAPPTEPTKVPTEPPTEAPPEEATESKD